MRQARRKRRKRRAPAPVYRKPLDTPADVVNKVREHQCRLAARQAIQTWFIKEETRHDRRH